MTIAVDLDIKQKKPTTATTFIVNVIYLWMTKSSLKRIVKLAKSSPKRIPKQSWLKRIVPVSSILKAFFVSEAGSHFTIV